MYVCVYVCVCVAFASDEMWVDRFTTHTHTHSLTHTHTHTHAHSHSGVPGMLAQVMGASAALTEQPELMRIIGE